MCAQPFVPGNDWTHLAVQGSSLLLAIDRGVQFLTRSHRTALTEQTGPVPRVTTTPLYILDTRSRLVTSGGIPGGRCGDSSFVCYGEFCQTPMVAPRGFEPHVSALKGPRPSPTRRRSHISLFLRHHLFYSSLLPHSHIPHIQYCPTRTWANWVLEWVVVERVNPCIRLLWGSYFSVVHRTMTTSPKSFDSLLGDYWLQERNSNPQSSGYEPDILPITLSCDINRAQFTLIIFQKNICYV